MLLASSHLGLGLVTGLFPPGIHTETLLPLLPIRATYSAVLIFKFACAPAVLCVSVPALSSGPIVLYRVVQKRQHHPTATIAVSHYFYVVC